MAGKDEVLVQGNSDQHSPLRNIENTTTDKFHHDAYQNLLNDQVPGADYMRKIADTSSRFLPDILIDEGIKIKDKLIGITHEPTKEETSDAQGKLNKQIDDLLPDDRKQNLKALQDAAVGGDPKAMADAIANIDPKDRAAYIKELNKNLDATNAGMHAQIDKAGNVVIYGDNSDKAVEIAPSGQATVRKVERELDGTVILKEGEVLGTDPSKVMKDLSTNAVNNINSPFGRIEVWKNPHKIDPRLLEMNNKHDNILL